MKDTPIDRVGPRAAADRIARRDLRGADQPGAQPRRGRRQAVRHRLRELHRRLARVLLRLRAVAAQAADARHRPLSPDRDGDRQDQRGVRVPPRDPPPRQPRRPLGQRPRRPAERRSRGARLGARARQLPRAHAHRPRLLRRQHQPRRRLDDRHAQHDQGAAEGAARAGRRRCARRKPPATTRRGWRCSRRTRRCRSGRCGTTTA